MFIDVRNGGLTRRGLAGLLRDLTDWQRCYGSSMLMWSSDGVNTVGQIHSANVKGGRVGEEGKTCGFAAECSWSGWICFCA